MPVEHNRGVTTVVAPRRVCVTVRSLYCAWSASCAFPSESSYEYVDDASFADQRARCAPTLPRYRRQAVLCACNPSRLDFGIGELRATTRRRKVAPWMEIPSDASVLNPRLAGGGSHARIGTASYDLAEHGILGIRDSAHNSHISRFARP